MSNEATKSPILDCEKGIAIVVCEEHSRKLREAVTARGMGSLIAPDGAALRARVYNQPFPPTNRSAFEPVFYCVMMIGTRFAAEWGGELAETIGTAMTEVCPICWLDTQHKRVCHDPDCNLSVEVRWIEGPANSALARAKSFGLVGDA